MKTITLEITDEDARVWAWTLRKEYGRDNHTPLNKLCEIAVRRAVLVALKKIVDETQQVAEID